MAWSYLMKSLKKAVTPEFVSAVLNRLRDSGHEAYIVGGAVRDILMHRNVSDWDITTSARSEEISAIFEDTSHFLLKHDTVTLVDDGKLCEVTPFRTTLDDGATIAEDLGRRDFTVNAMAYDPQEDRLIDPHGGRLDISGKLVRAVGDPRERFLDDPLRLLRAVRVAGELRFRIETKTLQVVTEMADQIAAVAKERVRDELMKILMCPKPSIGFNVMRRTALLEFFLPELLEGYRRRQNSRYHRFTIYKHILETVDRVDAEPVMRLTALLHDIAKPRVREKIAGTFRFYGHEEASAELAGEIMDRLKFSKDMIGQVTHLIRHHLIGYDSKWGDPAVRRLIQRVGPKNMDRLLALRRMDLLAHGIDDIQLHLLSELEERVRSMIEKPLAVKPGDLAIDGNTVMEILNLSPGPRIGKVLAQIMDKVIDHPSWNRREKLVSLLYEMKG